MIENSALGIAEKQRDWYRGHKTRARVNHYGLELAALALSFLVTVAGILGWNSAVPAVAGATVAVLAGLRGLFGFRESWTAFAAAEAELQKAIDEYVTKDAPDRDKQLVRRVHETRSSETEAWKSRKLQSTPPPPNDAPPGGRAGEPGGGTPPNNRGD